MSVHTKRSTIHFDPDLYRALRVKAAHTRRRVSALVNEAVPRALADDREDLWAFAERAEEGTITSEELLQDIKVQGKI